MEMKKFIEAGETQHLFLCQIIEPEENKLKIIVHPAKFDSKLKPIVIGEIHLKQGHEFWADKSKKTEIHFDSYIGYSVRNEINCPADFKEAYAGKRYRIYSHSKYLDYIKSATFILPDQEGKIQHYAVICENHTIDVISIDEPSLH